MPGSAPRFGILFVVIVLTAAGCSSQSPASSASAAAPAAELPANDAVIARSKGLELNTAYEPVPGNPLEHHTSGYAKTMCSAVFITGLDPDVAAENVGYFTGPYAERIYMKTITDAFVAQYGGK